MYQQNLLQRQIPEPASSKHLSVFLFKEICANIMFFALNRSGNVCNYIMHQYHRIGIYR
jgi:hypothetical protein